MGRRGMKHHLKVLAGPKHLYQSKTRGVFSYRPSSGPHKIRDCMPLGVLLRDKLKYALNGNEVKKILMMKHVQVDNKVRTTAKFPTGFMDVVKIPKTNEHFRMLYDTKGRFAICPINANEADRKLCRVNKLYLSKNQIPRLCTHDGRTFSYANPDIKVGDSIQINIKNNENTILDYYKFDSGTTCMVTGGRNLGRYGKVIKRVRHIGSFDIVTIKDSTGHEFQTRFNNVFVLGREKSIYRMPKPLESVIDKIKH